MNNHRVFPVILCDGTGMRLWPFSRTAMPKQLLALLSKRSMLQETVRCFQGFGFENPLLICNSEQRFMVAEQICEIGVVPTEIMLEPTPNNTAAAVAAAACRIASVAPDALMLVIPSDHHIKPPEAFRNACATAASLIEEKGYLVTFGIVPQGPETGYGYIVRGEALLRGNDSNSGYAIARLVEKPDRSQAEELLRQGGCYWNSGMFMFSVNRVLEEFRQHAPDILELSQAAVKQGQADMDFFRLNAEVFSRIESVSFGVAVMKKTSLAAVVPARFEWSDAGSWQALWKVEPKDEQGNVLRGDVFTDGVTGSYVRAESRFVAVLGLDDVVVVETPDAVLIADRNASQDVRKVVSFLEKQKRAEHEFHRRIYRPWGYYEKIDSGDRFLVKRIMVKPGASISSQRHHYRAEHWVVVNGIASVRRGSEEFLLSENESTFIPIGGIHRLSNPGLVPLHIIEVQFGHYLAEDDIVRFEDNYGRGQNREKPAP